MSNLNPHSAANEAVSKLILADNNRTGREIAKAHGVPYTPGFGVKVSLIRKALQAEGHDISKTQRGRPSSANGAATTNGKAAAKAQPTPRAGSFPTKKATDDDTKPCLNPVMEDFQFTEKQVEASWKFLACFNGDVDCIQRMLERLSKAIKP